MYLIGVLCKGMPTLTSLLDYFPSNIWSLTLVLLNPDMPRICPAFANSIATDQLASSEASWSVSALFAI